MQTWEYAPTHALRSYAYLLPSVAVAKGSSLFLALTGFQSLDKPQVWLGVKCFWALCSALSETLMYDAIKNRFGRRVGGIMLCLSVMHAGMFTACSSLLPSSTAMIFVCLLYALWAERAWYGGIVVGMVCSFGIGWPFVALLFVPFGLNCLYEKAYLQSVTHAVVAVVYAIFCAGIMHYGTTLVDSAFYGSSTSPNLNIVKYNVFGEEGRGDELYGTEPLSYYVKNLVLNTNVVFLLALALAPLAFLTWLAGSRRQWAAMRTKALFASPAFIWLALMASKPHKEERFLYPIYPIISLAAAMTLESFCSWAESAIKGQGRGEDEGELDQAGTEGRESVRGEDQVPSSDAAFPGLLVMSIVLFSAALGGIRSAAVIKYHSGPCTLFAELYYEELGRYWKQGAGHRYPSLNLCMAGEWYRYPSSFYLPPGVNLRFIQSHYEGQLPQPFTAKGGTSATPPQPFNDLNREEPSRYTTLSECDYVVERQVQDRNLNSPLIKSITDAGDEWAVVRKSTVLDSERSHPAFRAFYIPRLSDMFVKHADLVLFKRQKGRKRTQNIPGFYEPMM
ncbi:unnamed protein product [Chrysoparadoxa australica]